MSVLWSTFDQQIVEHNRTEAHATAAKPEAVGERSDWDEVVVAVLQLADVLERRVARLDVPRVPTGFDAFKPGARVNVVAWIRAAPR